MALAHSLNQAEPLPPLRLTVGTFVWVSGAVVLLVTTFVALWAATVLAVL